jgi:hypothetical protein
MAEEGVRFVVNAHVGQGLAAEKLAAEHDAVVLAAGATKPRDLPVEGRQLQVGGTGTAGLAACPAHHGDALCCDALHATGLASHQTMATATATADGWPLQLHLSSPHLPPLIS